MRTDPTASLLVERAAALAEKFHEGQKYGEFPYTVHVERVARRLVTLGVAYEPLLAAALLHDTLEDTEATRDGLRDSLREVLHHDTQHLATVTVDLVWAVTGEGSNRRERNKSIEQKILEVGRMAAILKAADRIENVESCYETKNPLIFMYGREYLPFREVLLRAPVRGRYVVDERDTTLDRAIAHLDRLMGYRPREMEK